MSQTTTTQKDTRSESGATDNGNGRSMAKSPATALVTDRGRTSIADSVVAKIAGIAAREVDGVHNMGTGAARAIGSIRDRVSSSKNSGVTQGVSVEVGERQAAIDLDVVMEFGVSIVDASNAIRDNVSRRIERMTGLEVTEVNISVDDIWLGEEEEPQEKRERVQ